MLSAFVTVPTEQDPEAIQCQRDVEQGHVKNVSRYFWGAVRDNKKLAHSFNQQ